MARPISSAELEKLFRYADFGTQLDYELITESSRLAGHLQQFEAACTEPGFQVNVGHLAGALRGYGQQGESIDGWVRQVGRGFQMADQAWSGAAPVGLTWALPSRASRMSSTVTLLPLISAPNWLGDLADFMGDTIDALGPTFQTQKAFVGTLWWPLGKFLNDLAGNQRAGWVGKMEGLGKALYRSPVIKALDSPLGGTLIGGTLELVAEGDYSFRGAGAAYTHAGTVTLVSLNPIGLKIIVANAVTQIGGAGLVWGTTRAGQFIASPQYDQLLEQNERRTYEALKKMDLTNITGSAAHALWGKGDWDEVIGSVGNVAIGTLEFADAWNKQVAITGISIGDRLARAIQGATDSFLLQSVVQ